MDESTAIMLRNKLMASRRFLTLLVSDDDDHAQVKLTDLIEIERALDKEAFEQRKGGK